MRAKLAGFARATGPGHLSAYPPWCAYRSPSVGGWVVVLYTRVAGAQSRVGIWLVLEALLCYIIRMAYKWHRCVILWPNLTSSAFVLDNYSPRTVLQQLPAVK